MQLLIKNKNNNKKYEIRQGLTITQNYNETLDSVELVISHIKEPINIEPYDECELISDKWYEGFFKDTDDNKYHMYMCVDKYNRKQLSVGQEPYYEYQISLFSQTKLLEGIILPNLKITRGTTPRKIYGDGTDAGWGYLDEYLKEYGQKQRTKIKQPNRPPILKWINKYEYSQKVVDRFSKIDCPEMQWNNPTLRQVITDLMMVDDCIPVLRNGVIDFIDLTKTNNRMITNNNGDYFFNYVEQSQSSDDYVSELRMNVKNAIQGKNEYIKVHERIGFRNSDTGVLNDNNIRLETTYPIYKLISLKMEICVKTTTTASKTIYYYPSANLTHAQSEYGFYPICVEKNIYDTKPIWYREFFDPLTYDFSVISKYQNFNVYYTRGGRTIEGWNRLTNKAFAVKDNIRTIDVIKNTLRNRDSFVYLWDPNVGRLEQIFFSPTAQKEIQGNLDNIFFEIDYDTTTDALFQASKINNVKNKRVVVDNQTNSYVDANAQGLLEYLKANRLGNKMLLINGRYKGNNTTCIGALSDTYEDSIIFRKQTSIFDDYALVNYYATKDYVLRDYFTGVQAKQRSWKLVSGNDALERHDLIKCYVELSKKRYRDVVYGNTFYTELGEIEEIVGKTFRTVPRYPYVTSALSFKDNENNTYPSESSGYDYYLSNLVVRNVGNSILFNTKMNDNIYFGKFINGETTNGYAQSPLRYADKNGENTGVKFVIAQQILDIDASKGHWVNEPTYSTPNFNLKIDAVREKPQIKSNQIVYDPTNHIVPITLDVNLKKDNSEIQNLTFQIEFCGDAEQEVWVSPLFAQYQYILGADLSVLSLYTSLKKPILSNFILLPDDSQHFDGSAYLTENNEIEIVGDFRPEVEYIYICDRHDRCLFVYSTKGLEGVLKHKIYINALVSRDKTGLDDYFPIQ